MKCEDCEYRFTCFTMPTDARPIRVKVNWKITNCCGKCIHVKFGTMAKGYTSTTNPVGICEKMSMLVHKDSMICDEKNFVPRKMQQIDRVYKALRDELSKKNRRSKLPKYCVEEE